MGIEFRRNAGPRGDVWMVMTQGPGTGPPTAERLLEERRWIDDLARRLVRDPDAAADVAQQAWVRALSRPAADVRSLRGWLRALVRSCAADRARSESRRRAREESVPARAPADSAADLVARADAQRRVLEAVLALDPPSRAVVLLRYFEGLEPGEIALRTGEPAGTVRSRLHRALASLRVRLDGIHGGDRSAWAAALLGPGALPATPPPSAPLAWKGVAAMSTGAKVVSGVAAAILVALLLRASADGVGAPPPAPPPPPVAVAAAAEDAVRPAPPAAPVADPVAPPAVGPVAPQDPPPPAADPGPRRLAARVLPARVRPGESGGGPARAPGGDGEEPAGEEAVIAGGDGEEGEIALGGFGGMTLEPGGSKWAPIPEKGTVTFRGTVVDVEGRPLEGAEVYAIEAEAGGVEGDIRDFRHIREIARTGADGGFAAGAQPARAVRLAANYHGAMNRRRGLLLQGLVPVDPPENSTVDGIRLAVAVDRDAFGGLRGRAVDRHGRPLRNIGVQVGFQGERTDAAGLFRVDGIAAGEVRVTFDDFGFRTENRTVRVEPRAVLDMGDVPLSLAVAEDLVLEGHLRDAEGKPVAGVPLWCGGGPMGFARDAVSGEDGSFRFEDLPRSLDGKRVVISVMTDPDEPGVLPVTKTGILVPTPGLVVEVERSVLLRVLLRDAGTGEALPLFAAEMERERDVDGERRWVPLHSSSLYREDGVWALTVPAGPLRLHLEAPDHQPLYLEVVVPADGPGPFEVEARLFR